MKAFVVGYRPVTKGYLYFCTTESNKSCVKGEEVVSVFSKFEHDLGDTIEYVWRKFGGEYKAYERT